MNILLINQDWFAKEFKELGHKVLSCGTARHLDVMLPYPFIHINTIISDFLNGFSPDVIIWLDNSGPVFTAGLEETLIPTVFYSVDAHHHYDVHKYLGHVFDLSFVAQKDYIHYFTEVGAEASWLPLYASRFVEAQCGGYEKKQYGAVFVGNLNAKLNPERVAFFEALGKEVPIYTTTGDYWKIFPFSEIVINQTVKGDLNFRVFEAMMCGSLLLTEASGNGLFDLFKDNVHLATYEKNNVQDAALKIRAFLDSKSFTRQIAAQGREEILNKHLPIHRASTILEAIKGLQKKKSSKKFFSSAINFGGGSRIAECIDSNLALQCLFASMRNIELALREGELLDEEIAPELIYTCIRFDQLFKQVNGEAFLFQLEETYPQIAAFKLAKIRILLNSGRATEASHLARTAFSDDIELVFRQAEEIIVSILSHSESKK